MTWQTTQKCMWENSSELLDSRLNVSRGAGYGSQASDVCNAGTPVNCMENPVHPCVGNAS